MFFEMLYPKEEEDKYDSFTALGQWAYYKQLCKVTAENIVKMELEGRETREIDDYICKDAHLPEVTPCVGMTQEAGFSLRFYTLSNVVSTLFCRYCPHGR